MKIDKSHGSSTFDGIDSVVAGTVVYPHCPFSVDTSAAGRPLASIWSGRRIPADLIPRKHNLRQFTIDAASFAPVRPTKKTPTDLRK